MKNRAINALIEMGMPADCKGFRYIVDAMCLFEDEEWRNGKLLALYHIIGKRNNDTYSNVEKAMRAAFTATLKKGNRNAVDKYLTRIKPSNGNLLHVLYLRLTQED